MEILLELGIRLRTVLEHVVVQQAGLLQWGDVLAHTVVELRVVAAGEELVYLVSKLMELLLLVLDLGCLHLSARCRRVEGGEAVAEAALSVGNIHALDAEEGVAAPGVDAHEEVDGMVAAAGEVPDEWGLREIHEEVEVVAELLEELLIEIFPQRGVAAHAHGEQIGELGDLRAAIASLHQLLLDAHIQWFLAHTL